MDVLRIFISSPGDVAEERERARQVVQGLRRRYAQHFDLVPVFWEDMPLSVDAPFQQGIDQILARDTGVDVAVFILWSRLGSRLGPLARREDGREYRSGTERELDLMLAARRAQGGERPRILAYARQDEAAFEETLRGRSTTEKEELLRQKKLVEEFLREEFHDAQTGANVRAYHTFARPQSFAERLRVHLQEILDGLCAGKPARAVWDVDDRGPPFRGLEAFGFEHAEIFFGREDEVAEARARLGEAARRGTAFLLIGGASGTGKSSLAAAGLLPEIVAHETDESVGRWLHAVFTPAALAGAPAAGMAQILAQAVPALADRGVAGDLAEALGRDPGLAVKLLVLPALRAAAQPGAGAVRLVLLVDQLEELFSDPRLGEAERATFAAILQALATSGAVWVVATLRGDWYPRLLECPALVALKTAGAQLDLVPPGVDAVRRMIESPAVLAGLSFEKLGTTSLADRILRDVADQAELLPLLEDLLRELFERRTDAGLLTFSAYESLGGIEGSLAKRAEATLAALPVDVQLALPEVLRRLVATGDGPDSPAVRRRAALASFASGTPARALVDRLVADRLATASAREDGTPEVTIAHEAILRVWPRAAAWIRENAEFLRVRDRLAARMRESAPLSAADPLLPAAQALLAAQRDAVEPELAAYVESQVTTIEADRRRREGQRRTVVAGLSVLSVAASLTAAAALWQWRAAIRAEVAAERASADAEAARVQAERARETAVTSRASAEGLVEFMTFDLGEKLRPIGRLDLMEDVLGRLRAYQDERMRLEEAGQEEVTDEDRWRRGAMFISLGDLARDVGDLETARQYFAQSFAIAEALAAHDPANIAWQQGLATSHAKLGQIAEATGDAERARTEIERALAIAESLVARDPQDLQSQAGLSEFHVILGDLARHRGDVERARHHYREALAIREALAAAQPDNTAWLWSLSLSHGGLGDLEQASGDREQARWHLDQARGTLEALVLVDPLNVDWRYDLAIAHGGLGDLAQSDGDAERAREHLERSLALLDALAMQDSRNTRWRRSLGIAHHRLGTLVGLMNDLDRARAHYELALATSEALAAQDPRNAEWQHDLSVGHERLGTLARTAGDLEQAREQYERSHVIREALAGQDPGNVRWRADLAMSHEKLGDLARAAGDLERARGQLEQALAIRQALAAQDPRNPDRQADLVWSHDALGDVAELGADFARARGHYEKASAIAHAAVASDPDDTFWLRKLAASHGRLGDVARAWGDLDRAGAWYENCRLIMESLAARDPHNGEWQRDLAIARARMAWLAEDRRDWSAARDWFREELEIVDRLGPDPRWAAGELRRLAECHHRLGEHEEAMACERRIAALLRAGGDPAVPPGP